MAAFPPKLELKKANIPFQFRDLRAKATTDKDEPIGIEEAKTLLDHSIHNNDWQIYAR